MSIACASPALVAAALNQMLETDLRIALRRDAVTGSATCPPARRRSRHDARNLSGAAHQRSRLGSG